MESLVFRGPRCLVFVQLDPDHPGSPPFWNKVYNELITEYNNITTKYNDKTTQYNRDKYHKTVLAFHIYRRFKRGDDIFVTRTHRTWLMEARSGQNCNNKIAPQVSFFQPLLYFLLACCVFSSAVQFFLKRLLITFSNVNYFSVSLVKFVIGSTNEFSHSYCNLFLTVLRIIFCFWYRELFFHWR